MRWVRIVATVLFVLFFVNLPHEPSCASLPWKGVSFHYRVHKVGATILKASLSIEREGPLYLVKAEVDTTGLTLPLFRMHNRFRSYVKEEGLEPQQYVKEVDQWGIFSQKKYYTDILTFDMDGSKVVVERVDPPQVREVSVPPQIYDPLAIFLKYFLDVKVGEGDKIEMRIYDGIKVREVIFIASHREITTPLYGEVRTICLESKVPFSSLGDREGVIKIWYTDDDMRFPVNISLELPVVGSVEFQLEKVQIW
ncbi:MAG: DUF3108 domain-containing protein [Deltaproteobacteria bacterium]|nr:DUF3108 domain-containing protein [Deltaproteobacteria bacterium]